MRKCFLAKEKKETWPFSTQCNLNILQHILLRCQPSPSRSIWRTIFRKIKVLRRSVSSSGILHTLRLKHFPLADIPDSVNSELSATQMRRMNPEPHFCCT